MSVLTSDQPLVCFTCNTRNYDHPEVTHCRGCGYKLKAGAPGPYRDLTKITRKSTR